MLEVRDLGFFKKNKKIIDGLCLQFKKGSVSAIVGMNGAGKSTFSRIIMGLTDYKEVTGNILFNGKSIKSLSVYERAKLGITLSWQEPVRFEGISVKKYLECSGSNNQKRIKEALERVGLEPEKYLTRLMDSGLSGGERKRIELASIYVMNPKVIILDEPDSGIDIDSLIYIEGLIKYFSERGAIVILVTHNISTMMKTDVAHLLCNGKLIASDSPDKIKYYFNKYCRQCKKIG